jgi:hypothetical protein
LSALVLPRLSESSHVIPYANTNTRKAHREYSRVVAMHSLSVAYNLSVKSVRAKSLMRASVRY